MQKERPNPKPPLEQTLERVKRFYEKFPDAGEASGDQSLPKINRDDADMSERALETWQRDCLRAEATCEELDIKLQAAKAEIGRLRAGIQRYLDGNYSNTKKNDKCKHGRYGFETCEACIDEYFMQLIAHA